MNVESKCPQTEFVRAADVKPYEWAQWCSVMDSKPFANDIVSVRKSEDGSHLWLMLESFNFIKAASDEVLELIPLLPFAEEVVS